MAQITLISIYLPLILSLMPFPLIVPTFYKKSTDVFIKKYGRFPEKVRTFFLESTYVFILLS